MTGMPNLAVQFLECKLMLLVTPCALKVLVEPLSGCRWRIKEMRTSFMYNFQFRWKDQCIYKDVYFEVSFNFLEGSPAMLHQHRVIEIKRQIGVRSRASLNNASLSLLGGPGDRFLGRHTVRPLHSEDGG
ncbi:hypothetical protein NDU88_000042 [Pleurodeles waltl]|uniref:Uncharacterized protein n=1 Tax=Pleurodeles waltl TaxID=8319 RepID=A0AAV7VVA8_PLEWA|nr:hypothetical protein NDU88_000042 [Pleurodeles waltl]